MAGSSHGKRVLEVEPRALLDDCLSAALEAVNGERVVRRAITGEGDSLAIAGERLPAAAGVFVMAVGKAGSAMARAAVSALGSRLSGGIVVTRDGHAAQSPPGLDVLHAGHPLPDERSAAAGAALLDAAARVPSGDVLLVLLSGGASALTSCPAAGLEMDDLVATTDALLACPADIEEINCLRKHLSAIAGGRLARAASAGTIHLLAISDVCGDRLDVIGSGPCSADPSRYVDAQRVVASHGLAARLPGRVIRHLESGVRGDLPESPKPGDPLLARVRATVVARNAVARRAALAAAGGRVRRALDLGEILQGEARQVGRRLVALARSTGGPGSRLLVAGGETVVTLRGAGRGGRSQELALSAALALDAERGGPLVHLLAVGTDGSDGSTDAAGACVGRHSVATARARGLAPRELLDDNDSHRFHAATDGLVHTGPTGTNVMDLALVLVS